MIDIALTDDPTREEWNAVRAGLVAYNADYLGPDDYRQLCLFARVEGRIVGGLLGNTNRRWLSVELFWVDAQHRRGGLGRDLLNRAEAEARARGCIGATLGTYDFQARPFYEKQGYDVFGTLEPYPNGHCSYYLRKIF
ncbi:MAG: GNAT family N-acetyltransferase [Ferrovibrionaceae bacterium]